MHRFQVIQPFLRVAAPGDILVSTLGNVSSFGLITVIADGAINLPPLANVSVLLSPSVVPGVSVDVILPALSNASSFPTIEVQEAPPDGQIRLPGLLNSSSVPVPVVQESPSDGEIRLPSLTNISTFYALSVSEDEEGGGMDDHDSIIVDEPIGSRMVE